ncbi:YjgN family protein [Bermanella sp. R86510]|uniref:YjgN family protein n=1 Tax=unclassified Bermanella TaxID=2627862 RepID=UPI0037C5FD3D
MDEITQPSQQQDVQSCKLEFRGDGLEYFKIWITNIALTIITFGIYSAWATVRNKRYFHSNLYLDNHNFNYLADPITILKGRIIAIVAFIAFNIISGINPMVGGILSLALLVAIPWIICRALAFDRAMSAYKNIRFAFHGKYGEALMAFLIWPLLGTISLGILMPYAILKVNEFLVNNTSYGTSRFKFSATYKDYGLILLTMAGAGLVLWTPIWAIQTFAPSLAGLSMIIMIGGYLALMLFFTVTTMNLFYRSTSIEQHTFTANITMGGLAKVFIINTVLTIITLGLYLPAAQVRMAKYVCDCLTLEVQGDLDRFTAAQQESTTALGSELGQVFDVGI